MKTTIRPGQPADQGYVASTWEWSLGKSRETTALIDRLLDHPLTRVLVASSPEHPELIFGWCCYAYTGKTKTLHYVYVRGSRESQFRRHGLASAMMREAGFDLAGPIVHTLKGPDYLGLASRYNCVYLPCEEFMR